jgi:hypothetical protein
MDIYNSKLFLGNWRESDIPDKEDQKFLHNSILDLYLILKVVFLFWSYIF